MRQPRRELDPVGTRRKILSAALETFSELGYAGSSIHAIAKRANLQKAHVQYHFGTKDDLWISVLEHATREFTVAVEEALTNPNASFEQILTARFGAMKKHPNYARLIAWTSLGAAPESPVLRERLRRLLSHATGAHPSPAHRNLPPEHIAAISIFATQGWFQFNKAEPDPDFETYMQDDDAFFRSLCQVLFHPEDAQKPKQAVVEQSVAETPTA